MKNIYILLLLPLPLLISCNGEDVRRVEFYHADILKFTNPEYKNYIYAEDTHGTIRFRDRGNRRVCDEFIAGKCPYIDLGEGYVLVDWKFPWSTYNHDVIMKKPWSEMMSLDQSWDRDSVEILPWPYIAEGEYRVYFYDIDAYLNVLKKQGFESSDPIDFAPYDYGWMHNLRGNSLKESERKKYTECVAMGDSIQDEYVQKLKYIIHSGNFPFKVKYNWW